MKHFEDDQQFNISVTETENTNNRKMRTQSIVRDNTKNT